MRFKLLIAMLMLAGCDMMGGNDAQPSPANETEGPAPTAAQLEKAQKEWEAKIVLPVDPKHRTVALTPAWLEGYWVGNKAACYGSDSGIHFTADGRYSEHEAGGTLRIEGDKVRITVTEVYAAPDSEIGKSEDFRVRLIGPNEIETVWSDGGRGRLFRCPPGGMKE